MKIRLSFFFIFLVLSIASFAQKDLEDVIYLKNGSFLRGTIVEVVPGKSVTIQVAETKKLEINLEDIEKMTRENVPDFQNPKYEGKIRKRGLQDVTELGIMVGISEYRTDNGWFSNAENPFTIFTAVDYIFNYNFCTGAGMGYDKWDTLSLMPFFVDLRVNLMKKAITPFLFADAGYALGWSKTVKGSDKGGMMFNAGVGAKLVLEKSVALNFSLGYKLQNIRSKDKTNHIKQTDLHFITLRAGLTF